MSEIDVPKLVAALRAAALVADPMMQQMAMVPQDYHGSVMPNYTEAERTAGLVVQRVLYAIAGAFDEATK